MITVEYGSRARELLDILPVRLDFGKSGVFEKNHSSFIKSIPGKTKHLVQCYYHKGYVYHYDPMKTAALLRVMATQPLVDPNDPLDHKATFSYHSTVYFRLPERVPPQGRSRPAKDSEDEVMVIDDIEEQDVNLESENPESGAPSSPKPGPSTGP
jgi:hypothetical protein